MKKFSYFSLLQHSLITLALALISNAPANAYTIIDQANLNLNLAPGWKLINISRSSDLVVTSYTKNAHDTDQKESLISAQLSKEANQDSQAAIREMMDRINKQALAQHCESLETANWPQANNKFQVWTQTFQCKPSVSGIIQVYVDIDPETMYLFTYTSPHYPFTQEMRDKANQLLKASIEVCYKGQACMTLN
jgi:hypothetical protein